MRGIKFSVLLVFLMLVITVCALPLRGDVPGGFISGSSGGFTGGYRKDVQTITSSYDQDGDGIDDQTDILQNALAYVARRPGYKNKYYASGYPDDGCGVCTDVVDLALLDAGYDMMQLVYYDICNNPGYYGVDVPDINIDFRRVKNLHTYFSRYAIPLTTDVYDTEQWQGGDIVIMDEHIGIVSDKRNSNGVPYLIHHYGSFQLSYEEDVLEKRNDIIAHYRMTQ